MELFTFLLANLATILVCVALAAILTLVVVKLIRDKKSGKGGCGCGCGGCQMKGVCHARNNKRDKSVG